MGFKGYYIKIKGYRRKDGTLVSSHYRKLEYRIKIKKFSLVTKEYDNPNQLTINF
tara:strand:+ start:314 stop:478 length:165 start_codon:yes stop_codon:yes gene_type:complete